MRVAWLPLYDEQGASSRIRVFTLHRQLLKLGYESVIGWDDSADVQVVQKHTSDDVLEKMSKHKGCVVYDFDDDARGAGAAPAFLERVSKIAHVITTDTIGHLAYALPHIGHIRAVVLPDAIDYYPTQPLPASKGKGAVWFGGRGLYYTSVWMVDALLHEFVQVATITDSQVTDTDANFVPWDLGTFVPTLRNYSVALLSHRDADQGKSVNKMTTAITYGIPCIVGHSIEYEELAHAMGVGWSIARTADEVVEIYGRLSNAAERDQYLRLCQPYVWRLYSPEACALRFLDVVQHPCRSL